MKYLREDDRKRALVSRLLQRRACVEATGVPWAQVELKRTKGGKPFMANKPAGFGPNWNWNVSHEGHFVALAAEARVLCGIDVAAPDQVRDDRQSFLQTVADMRAVALTSREHAAIMGASGDVEQQATSSP